MSCVSVLNGLLSDGCVLCYVIVMVGLLVLFMICLLIYMFVVFVLLLDICVYVLCGKNCSGMCCFV